MIITSDEALGEVSRKPDLFLVPRQRRLILGHLAGESLVIVDGEALKVGRL